jgi:cellulose synthase operon protein C
MTVRWKPLVFLSGVFLIVGVIGVSAIILTLAPRSTQASLSKARTSREAGRFEHAEIYYKQSLQDNAKDAAIHEEFAGLYRDWAKQAAAEKKASLRHEQIDHLRSAVRYGKAIKGPRIELLREAMRDDDVPSSNSWAAEVLNVDPQNLDAHYTLALKALDSRPTNLPEARQHFEVISKKNASPIRVLLIRAMLADASGDLTGRAEVLARARATDSGPDAGPVDRLAALRLASMTVQFEADPARLGEQVTDLLKRVKEMGAGGELAPAHVARLRFLLEQSQKSLMDKSATARTPLKKGIDQLVDSIEAEVESIFKVALSGRDEPDLQTYRAYADHLKLRNQRDRCLEVIEQALKSPQASRRAGAQIVMMLHVIAVEMALSVETDKARYDKADPHIRALLDHAEPKAQAFGHLFAGMIELDRSNSMREGTTGDRGAAPKDAATRLRISAVKHLKIAATSLPDIAEAQARYGVALVLAGEQNLGRQFLQTALRLGSLDPQFQLWAAWAILQAGYPEEAEPIVVALLRDVAAGNASRDLEAGLYLLSGEIHQSRRTPDNLEKAVGFFEKALATGKETNGNVVFRLAQIDVQSGQYDRALARIDALKTRGQESAAAEQLAVLTLEQQGKSEEATKRLQAARVRFPDGAELAGIDAALLNKHGKPAEADRVLADFLVRQPDNATLVMMRAQIQAESLKNVDQARSLLLSIGDKSENSAPLVQLAGLELERNELDAAGAVIAKIRSRWREAATSDVLEAQLALKRGHPNEAIDHFDAALRKDPGNKIVQYWKAQLDGQTGDVEEATRSLEAIIKNKPIKEVDTGTTLMSAAQSALAGLSLRTGALDDAIRRFEELKRSSENGTLSKSDRWLLITAYVARGQWPVARREIASLLNDPKNPPSVDERVRGANFYRQQGDDAAAQAQLDYVLKDNPCNPPAVVTRSYIHLKAKQHEQASSILRTALEQLKQKKEPQPAMFYLLLAAVENDRPPTATAFDRAIAILDAGLSTLPGALELVQAKYYALKAVGKTPAAVEFVEAKAKAFPKSDLPRELVKVYRDERLYGKADHLLRSLVEASPDDTNLAAALIQVVSLEAAEAGAKQQPDRQREFNNQAASMIREYRSRFKGTVHETVFAHAECDMAFREGDLRRAIELAHEMDKLSKTSPMGALLRARIYALQGKTRDLAQSYREALDRAPRQLELRVLLGQTELKLGDADSALRQATMVLDVEKNRLDARLLQARALAESGKSPTEKDRQQRLAISQLEEITKANSRFEDAFHTLAEIQFKRGNHAAAVAVWKDDLKGNPADAAAASRLIETLATRPDGDNAPGAADLSEATRFAAEITAKDQKGSMNLAVAIGFHKARQFELALPYAETAATKLGTPAAHLNLGDLLLTLAESQSDQNRRRSSLERAIAEYDLVLKAQPNSVEAINNKAWILHSYLDQSRRALELVLALQKRVNSAALPVEFYDTLGSIQESIGKITDAERAYTDGLKKSPDHPVLNFHFGKMIAADRSRAVKALPYLKRAIGKLSPPMNQEATRLVQLIDRKDSIQ